MVAEDSGWLRMARRCNNACRFCCDADALDGSRMEAVDLLHALRRYRNDGGTRVTLSGGEPTLSPHLLVVLKAAKDLGLQAALVTNGRALSTRARLDLLSDAGLDELCVSLHGASAATHDALVGVKGAFAQTLSCLELAPAQTLGGQALAHSRAVPLPVQVRTVLCADNVAELPALGAKLSELGVQSWQLRELACEGRTRTSGLAPAEPGALLRALDELQARCARSPLRLELHGLRGRSELGAGPSNALPVVLNPILLQLLRHGIVPPSASVGVRLRDDAGQTLVPEVEIPEALIGLVVELDARGVRVIDLPDMHARWRPSTPRPRVVVVSPPGRDTVLHGSTLPQLAVAMARRGASVELVSPYDPDQPAEELFTVQGPPPSPLPLQLPGGALEAAELVVVNDYASALAVLDSGRLGPDARLVISDTHMLHGFDRWVERFGPPESWAKTMEQGWPDPRVYVHSHFPGYLHLYRNYGIRFAQLHFRPYCLAGRHFPVGSDPLACDVIHAGGNHLRDWSTLRAALERLSEGAIHPIEWFEAAEREVKAPNLRRLDRVLLPEFYAHLVQARFTVVPLLDDPTRAAGVTVMVMALMAGRPVIASDIPAARDHLRHGVDSLLVPPGDASALAEAILRLDTDRELLERLAAGARVARERLEVDAWAEELLGTPDAPQPPGSLQRLWQVV